MTPRVPGFPPRPMLRPGTLVTRRGDGLVQVGLDEPMVRAPDTPPVRAVLDGISTGVAPGETHASDPAVLRLCADLVGNALVLDGDVLLRVLGTSDDPASRADLAAEFCSHGDRTPQVLAQRGDAAVAISHSGLDEGAAFLEARLRGLGLRPGTAPGLVLHVCVGEADRGLVDEWVREDRPHLLVSSTGGTITVGPFVVPGQTACLRCLDAQRTEHDPRWPLVLAQHTGPRLSPDGVPEPVPRDLLEMALLWVARDVTTWIDGGRPRSWSATIRFTPDLALPRSSWRPHVACGCSWAQVIGL